MSSTGRFDDRLAYNVAWVTLHVMARAMDAERALGFVCFVQGMRDLFPLADVRETLTAFMKERPLTPDCEELKTNRAAFHWTFDLHNYATWLRSKRCGKPAVLMPTEEQAWSLYGPERYQNNSWGSVFWALYHYMAANLPAELSHQQYIQWIAFVQGFQIGLPCKICREHMHAFLGEQQLNKQEAHYRVGMNNWLFSTKFHNEVNARLGKLVLNAQQLEEMRQALLVDSSAFGTLICPI